MRAGGGRSRKYSRLRAARGAPPAALSRPRPPAGRVAASPRGTGEGAFIGDVADADVGRAEALGLGRDRPFGIAPAYQQHRAQLGGPRIPIEDLSDVLELEAELLEHEDAVEACQLIGAVEAVAGLRIGLSRPEQADLVIEAQLPRRHAGDPREIADLEHRVSAP